MENKVLVDILVPKLEKEFEVYLPANKTIGEIVVLLAKALSEMTNGSYEYWDVEKLYDRNNCMEYDNRLLLKETDIRNGKELIYM